MYLVVETYENKIFVCKYVYICPLSVKYPSVGQSVGLSVLHNFLIGREITLPMLLSERMLLEVELPHGKSFGLFVLIS